MSLMSLKRDTADHPPIFMASLSTELVDHLKILGFIVDRQLTWSNMIEHMSSPC